MSFEKSLKLLDLDDHCLIRILCKLAPAPNGFNVGKSCRVCFNMLCRGTLILQQGSFEILIQPLRVYNKIDLIIPSCVPRIASRCRLDEHQIPLWSAQPVSTSARNRITRDMIKLTIWMSLLHEWPPANCLSELALHSARVCGVTCINSISCRVLYRHLNIDKCSSLKDCHWVWFMLQRLHRLANDKMMWLTVSQASEEPVPAFFHHLRRFPTLQAAVSSSR